MQGVAKQGKSKSSLQAEQSGYWGRGRVSISSNRSHLPCVLVTAGKDMGVAREGVVVQLALGVGVWMPGLVTAMAGLVEQGVVDIARLAEAMGGW